MENKQRKKKEKKFKKCQVFNIHPVEACYFIHIEFGLFYYACMIFTHKGGLFIRHRAARNSS